MKLLFLNKADPSQAQDDRKIKIHTFDLIYLYSKNLIFCLGFFFVLWREKVE